MHQPKQPKQYRNKDKDKDRDTDINRYHTDKHRYQQTSDIRAEKKQKPSLMRPAQYNPKEHILVNQQNRRTAQTQQNREQTTQKNRDY